MTASGNPIKHEPEMRELAEVILLPKEVAVVKCKGHDKSESLIARGNQAADEAAKKVAGYETCKLMLSVDREVTDLLPQLSWDVILSEQDKAWMK